MRRSIKKFLWVITVLSAFLFLFVFGIIYQEFGPVNHSKLVQIKVRDSGLVADFFYRKNDTNLPLIIALGGSGGGFLPEKEVQSLALHGYAVLSVAYINVAGLPNRIENIPLEYFNNAINWACSSTVVDSNKVIVLGVSRGAELALLLASRYPRISAVVAYSPGCFILPNAVDTDDSIATHSSWTVGGKPLTFAPIRIFKGNHQKNVNYRDYIIPLLDRSDSERYTINMENSNGPILLLSGSDDQIWPSAEMAGKLERRLNEKQFSHQVRNIIIPGAGHSFFQLQNGYQIISSICFNYFELNIKGELYKFNNGGRSWANVLGRRQSREEVLNFLEQFK
jgi:dienelactone hydrolase